MSDLKDLEFLAAKSKDIVDKQIASYRQKQTVAGSIIAIIALFIPLFMNGLDDAYTWIKISMLLPVSMFVLAICMLLFHILRPKILSQAIGFNKFQSLINDNNYEKVLLYEIGANKSSFEDNEKITEKPYRYFNYSVVITIVSIIISVCLLMANKFYKPVKESQPIKVEITKAVQFSQSNRRSSDTIRKNVKNNFVKKP